MDNDNGNKGKIHELPIDRHNLKALVEQMIRDMAVYNEYVRQLARIRKMAYDAYIVEGFNPDQSTILCQNMLFTG